MSSKVKKVCYLLGGSKLSGAEKRIIITAIELSKDASFDITLITSEELKAEFEKSELSAKNISAIRWETRKVNRSSNKYMRRAINLVRNVILNLIQLPKTNSFVHIVLYSNATLLSVLIGKLLGNSKYFYEVTSPDVAASSATKNLIKYDFLADKLICVSESVEKRLGSIKPQKKYVRKQPLAYLGENQSTVKKENLVVYAHRLIERKNPLLAVQAFEKLAKSIPDWSFYICGDGELKEEVENRVSLAKLSNLEYKGYVYDMDNLMKRSKIFVSLIEPDNYPSQSVFNAMANGNAIIVSDTGSSKNKFISTNGYAVELCVESISEHINILINRNEVAECADNSIMLYKTKYGQDLYFEESKRIYS